MCDTPLTTRLAHFAARLETDPCFVAFALARVRRTHGLTADGLASALGLPGHLLPLLALCRRPLPTAPTFSTEVRAIATRVGMRPDRLVWVLVDGSDAPW